MPSSARPRITRSTSPTSSGSSAEVGSSNRIASGRMASARAMENGKDVLVEKPIALTVPDAERAVAAAARAGRV
ncbi:MAG: Gfo/Idh/MocA family oxidoreductase, partial [Actinomycetospora chiangmaiensis]|nr:Gfo/Idh/MocA family oxidoreductase [Actinomycetospora chiangmaiensis]